MAEDQIRKAMTDAMIIWASQQWVTIDILHGKGLITYSDVQEAIASVRERIPKELYSPGVAQILNIMEQTYQSGGYSTPLDPQRKPLP